MTFTIGLSIIAIILGLFGFITSIFFYRRAISKEEEAQQLYEKIKEQRNRIWDEEGTKDDFMDEEGTK